MECALTCLKAAHSDATSAVAPRQRIALGVGFLALVLLTLAAVRVDDPAAQAQYAPLLTASKALLGLVFALSIEGSRVAIFGSIVNGQLRKKDQAEAAAAEAGKERAAARRAKIKAESGWSKLAGTVLGSMKK